MFQHRGRHRRPTIAALTIAPFAAVGVLAIPPTAHAGEDYPGIPERWEDLAACESGGDPNAVNSSSGAAGWAQFMPSTWDAHAPDGYPDYPTEATAAQQTVVAENVLASQGPDAWVCDGAPSSPTDIDAEAEADAEVRTHSSAGAGSSGDTGGDSGSGAAVTADPLYPADNYVIRPGDTLASIAAAHGTTVAALAEANPRTVENHHLIYPGEGLYIPAT